MVYCIIQVIIAQEDVPKNLECHFLCVFWSERNIKAFEGIDRPVHLFKRMLPLSLLEWLKEEISFAQSAFTLFSDELEIWILSPWLFDGIHPLLWQLLLIVPFVLLIHHH